MSHFAVGVKGNWQGQSIYKSVFTSDGVKKSYNITLNSYKAIFNKCGYSLPMDKKVNLSRSAAMNRADDLGAENTKNNLMSSHEMRAKKTNATCDKTLIK